LEWGEREKKPGEPGVVREIFSAKKEKKKKKKILLKKETWRRQGRGKKGKGREHFCKAKKAPNQKN